MSGEDWDKDKYVACEPTRFVGGEMKANILSQGDRARGRAGGSLRGGRGGMGGGDSFRVRGRGRGNVYRDTERGSDIVESNSCEGDGDSLKSDVSARGRGGRGRGARGDQHKRNDSDNSFNRGRGRGAGSRGKLRSDAPSSENEELEMEDNNATSSSNSDANTNFQSRGVARGRSRSATRRYSDSQMSDKNENNAKPTRGGRGRGRGATRNVDGTSKSDNEESQSKSEEGTSCWGRGRGRGGRGTNRTSDRGVISRGSRGGRGRGGRGGSKPGEDDEMKNYIPPEPTDDEDIMFHSGITSGSNFNKYDTIGVDVTGVNPPNPIGSFESAGLQSILLKNIKKSGYVIPTPVQKNAIPIISAGRDLMACAQTGSGKTAAFLIPVINDLLNWTGDLITGNSIEPLAVVLSPTRELALQIFHEARKFAHGSSLKVAVAYGGTVTSHQLKRISEGCHILVAVPGRLENFINNNHVKFSSVKYFILDEADRMLDLGFKEAVKNMLNHQSMTPLGERRTVMFSATFPQDIQEMAAQYLHNYMFVAVGVVGGACSDVEQLFYKVTKFDKRDKLLKIIKENRNADDLTLVFVGMKRQADFLAVVLCENDTPTTSIHGDRYQSQREEALADFKAARRSTLIATAVAARGLDIKNVSHVINYDLPKTIEEYVHRIGRTGRVGNSGKSTSFYDTETDQALAKDLVRILEQANQPVPDFLKDEAANSIFSASGIDEFAGTDIRTANSTQDAGNGAHDEECWD